MSGNVSLWAVENHKRDKRTNYTRLHSWVQRLVHSRQIWEQRGAEAGSGWNLIPRHETLPCGHLGDTSGSVVTQVKRTAEKDFQQQVHSITYHLSPLLLLLLLFQTSPGGMSLGRTFARFTTWTVMSDLTMLSPIPDRTRARHQTCWPKHGLGKGKKKQQQKRRERKGTFQIKSSPS